MQNNDWTFCDLDDAATRAIENFFRGRRGWQVDEGLIRYSYSYRGADPMPKRFCFSEVGIDFLEVMVTPGLWARLFPCRVNGGCPDHHLPAQEFSWDAVFSDYPWEAGLHGLHVRAVEFVINPSFVEAIEHHEQRARDIDPSDVGRCVLFGSCAMTTFDQSDDRVPLVPDESHDPE